MKRFKNMLLVSGEGPGERATLARAVALARRNRARLTLVEVVERLPREIRMLITAAPPVDLVKLVIKDRREGLEALVAPLPDEGIRVSALVLFGTPFLEIVRQVVRRKHDLVILTAEGKARLKERLFGSTSMHLLRKCPCPVWVVKPTRRRRYSRILAAVDPDPSDEERNAINRKIMDLATSLAQMERSELHVVHAWTVFGEYLLRGSGRIPKSKSDKLIQETRDAHTRMLEDLLGRYDLSKLRHRVHLVKGPARALIPAVAGREQIDLLVMGTVCRTGVPGFLIGNTAENVLQQVDCSVLAVKPEGFVTPVKL